MLEQKVLETIQKYNLIQEGDKIVIGVSGGPDSMCLLDILYCLKNELNIELAVCHINHMIRKEAEEETKYVEAYCEEMGVPCFVKYADVIKLAEEQKLGIEEMGRKIRYDFFEEVAKKEGANKIATAHNSNDNAETVLMNLLRGSGTAGLKGIEIKCSKFAQNSKEKDYQISKDAEKQKLIYYIRPLRECKRNEIEGYCQEKKLNPKIDKSNFEMIYTRNKIRNELIPYLQKEFNPNVIETLNRLSDLAKQEDEYFKEIVSNQYESLKIGQNEKEIEATQKQTEKKQIILDLKKFNNLPKVIKGKLILYTINKTIDTTQGIGKIHIEDIIKLCENNIGNKYLIPNKKIKIFIKKGKIYFLAI